MLSLIRQQSKAKLLLFILLPLSAAVHAKAAEYDALTDYSAANPSGSWRYGQGTLGSSFTPFTVFDANVCFGLLSLSCWHPATTTLGTPEVGKNLTGSTFSGTTFIVPGNALHIHPGASSDVILEWTAPASGTYNIAGFFELLDSSPTGVIGEVYDGSNRLFQGLLTGPPASQANLTSGGSESFSLVEALTAGTIISFGVNNDGNFLYDSTGFNATITSRSPAVPEPESILLAAVGCIALACLNKIKPL